MKTRFIVANKNAMVSHNMQIFTRTNDVQALIRAGLLFINKAEADRVCASFTGPKFQVIELQVAI